MGKEIYEIIDLAFNKNVKVRKQRLESFDQNTSLDQDVKIVTLPDFDHTGLILFSLNGCEWSIPSVCKGSSRRSGRSCGRSWRRIP